MHVPQLTAVAASLLLAVPSVHGFMKLPLTGRGLPAEPEGVKTIKTPSGVKIRYKMPGDEGVCETTPGVKSYSGYIDLGENMHTFFWFFESRRNPAEDPVTLWLNGGPGSDSLIGLFQELGPCRVTKDLQTKVFPYAWNSVSNLLFLSQPFGVGFSYAQEKAGSHSASTGEFVPASEKKPDGRWPVVNAHLLDTTELAAVAAYHVLQGFYSGLSQLDSTVTSKSFNLWTESYGGHYGPAFYNYFYDQNQAIKNGSMDGTQLKMNSLGVGNGIIDYKYQAQSYPEFAANNTYGIKAIDDFTYQYMTHANHMPYGCQDYIAFCRQTDHSSFPEHVLCSEATNMCRDNVEAPYYNQQTRGVYDIRHPYNDPVPADYFFDYLNQAHIQDALGVDLNYTSSNNNVYWAFQSTGDHIYENFLEDLEMLLDNDVHVALYYGDADYICNWFGGEKLALAAKYKHAAQFAKAGYQKFMVDGEYKGDVRQYGHFSFLRIFEAGHLVPYYQPGASLEFFYRAINHLDIAEGKMKVSPTYSTTGPPNSTHQEPFVPLPSGSHKPDAARAAGLRGMAQRPTFHYQKNWE